MRLSRCAARIHGYHASRFALRDRCETFPHAPEKGSGLLLETVFVMAAASILRISFVAASRPAHAGMRIRIEQQREIRLQISAQHPMQLPHRIATQATATPPLSLGPIPKHATP